MQTLFLLLNSRLVRLMEVSLLAQLLPRWPYFLVTLTSLCWLQSIALTILSSAGWPFSLALHSCFQCQYSGRLLCPGRFPFSGAHSTQSRMKSEFKSALACSGSCVSSRRLLRLARSLWVLEVQASLGLGLLFRLDLLLPNYLAVVLALRVSKFKIYSSSSLSWSKVSRS